MNEISLPLQSGHGVLLITFAVALIAPRLGRLLKLPDLVGLIVGGAIVGPHVLGLIERTGTIQALGTAGLLYLMFQAGLELDPDDFSAQRKTTAVFGVLTFAIPITIGLIVHLLLGFSALAAILLGSCWASHTLLTYPMFQKARAVSNRAVSIGVAGTVITDTAALLVLVVVARAYQGELTAASLLLQIPMLIGAGAIVLIGLPKVTSWFFSSIGRDRPARFLFVMVALYGSSLLAEFAGVEPIIGAFFAGLAMNRQIVEGSELDETIHQFGSTFLVPIFLISVGMLIDPSAALTDRRTLLLAAAFTAVVLVGKSLAAAVTTRIYHLDGAERLTLIALSVPQAAATLAAVFVGFKIGLLGQETVDAVIVVILITCLFGTVAANRAINRLPPAPTRATPIGKRIIVPLPPGGTDQPTIELAAALGRRDNGTVYPLSVLDLGSTNAEVTALRHHMVSTAERTALANRCEAHSIVRLDLTPTAGLIHAAIETAATMILLPWDGHRTSLTDRFNHTADTLLDLANAPVVIAKTIDLGHYRRIVLRLEPDDLAQSHKAASELTWLVGARLADHLKIPIVLATTANSATIGAIPSISSHVTEVLHVDDASQNKAESDEDLVIRPLGETLDDRANLWVALPRVAGASLVNL